MNFRRPRQRDKAYLSFISQLSCVSCLAKPVECAHVRMAEAEPGQNSIQAQGPAHTSQWRYGKRPTGMSEKPDDKWTVPLCPMCHRLDQTAQHLVNEREFWFIKDIDVLGLCKDLQGCYPDVDRAEQLIRDLHG